jgi:uncharacterized protein (TIGR04255 family)
MNKTIVLPKYKRPPVVEVAVSVFFGKLPNFKSAHFGLFAARNPEYPNIDDRMPFFRSLPWEGPLPPLRRAMFLTADGNNLIQVQPDSFAHNWRKTKLDDQYPSFDKARELFLKKWGLFKAFVSEMQLGQIEISECEVTYVNHLFDDAPEGFPVALEKYSPVISVRRRASKDFLPNPRSLQAALSYPMPDDVGNLNVSFKHGPRQLDAREAMQMDLTATVKVKKDGSDLEPHLELAHQWIVLGFTELTSDAAHQIWGRTK